MNVQTALKILLASSVAACCISTANAQNVDDDFSGIVASVQGTWSGNPIGQAATFDFSYDDSQLTESFNNGVLTDSAPLTFAGIVSGYGAGTNLEPDGAGTGLISENFDTITDVITETIDTSAKAPSPGFTGDVFGVSYFTDGVNTTLEIVRNAFKSGRADSKDSGKAFISDVGPATTQAPELDPASTVGGLTLLLGGLAVMRGKKFAKATSV